MHVSSAEYENHATAFYLVQGFAYQMIAARASMRATSSIEARLFIESRGSRMKKIASYCLAAVVASTATAIAEPGNRQGPAFASHDPTHLAEPIYWCAVHASKGDLVSALTDCDYAVLHHPTIADAYSNRGALYLQMGNPVRALADLDRAVALSPNEAMMHYNRGVAQSEAKNSQAAIRDFSRATELNPGLISAYHNRGREYEQIGERALAIADFERALSLDPGFALSAKRLRILRGDL